MIKLAFDAIMEQIGPLHHEDETSPDGTESSSQTERVRVFLAVERGRFLCLLIVLP